MEVIYKCAGKYTRDEHLKFESFAYRHSGRAKKVALYCVVMLAVAVGLLLLLSVTGKLALKTLWLPLMWVALAVFYAVINGSMGHRLSWKLSPQIHDAQQKYFFYADHIEYYIGDSGITVPYEAIHSLGETGTNIYIMLSERQGMSFRKDNAPRNLPAFLRDRYNETHK